MNYNLSYVAPLLAVATGAAAFAIYYAKQPNNNKDESQEILRPDGFPAWIKTIHPKAFSLSYACGAWGQGDVQTSNHLLLSEDDCEALLKKQESSTVVKRTGNLVVRWDAGIVGSNSPCEDRYAVDLIPQSRLPGLREAPSFWKSWGDVRQAVKINKVANTHTMEGDGSDDLLLFSVIDGHGGRPDLAELFRKVLHPTIAFAIGAKGMASADTVNNHNSEVSTATEEEMIQALRNVLIALDNDILQAPLNLLWTCLPDYKASHLLPSPSPALIHLAELSFYGACTTTAMIDVPKDKLYVANVGDCRAVAGWWNPQSKMWRCDVLTDIGDCDGDNEEEAERCRNKHPKSERNDVICDLGDTARVLGTYQTTRSFGDHASKGQTKDKTDLEDAFGFKYNGHKKPYLTPPYMSAEPDIVSRDLHPASGEQLKFIVLATDGLWDSLSSEEVTYLLAAHLQVPQGENIPKSIIPLCTPLKQSVVDRPFPAQDLPGTTPENSKGEWLFKDENAATHLIRNCLGRGDDWERRRLLSMKDGLIRGLRDDVTAIVVRFDEVGLKPTAP